MLSPNENVCLFWFIVISDKNVSIFQIEMAFLVDPKYKLRSKIKILKFLFETEMSERTNTSSAFWCVIAEWFVLCKSYKEASSNKQNLSTSRTVKYWRGELTNQLREYKYRHIKPIFRSDYSHHAFLNKPFRFFPINFFFFGIFRRREKRAKLKVEGQSIESKRS